MNFILVNNFNTTLSAASSSTATTFTVSSSANLPTLAAGEVLPITLNDAATRLVFEICYVTSISGNILTVERAQEGTNAQNWNVGDYIWNGPTAGTALLQNTTDPFTTSGLITANGGIDASWINTDSFFNVKFYGATGNGSTDDTTAIQNALNAAGTANGGIVYLPVGTYNISSTLSIPTNVTLEGVSYAQDVTTPTTPASVIVWTPTAAYSGLSMIQMGPNTANSKIFNLALRSNTDYVVDGIDFTSVRQAMAKDLSINGTHIAISMSTSSATGAQNTAQSHISNINIGLTDYGVYIAGNSSNSTFVTENYFSDITSYFTNTSGIVLDGSCDSNYFYFIQIGQTGTSSSFNGVLLGSVSGVDREYFYGLSISGTAGTAINLSNANAEFYGVEFAGSFTNANVYISSTSLMSHFSSNTGSTSPKTINGPTSGYIYQFEGYSMGGLHTVTFVFSNYENDTTTSQDISYSLPFNKVAQVITNDTGLSLTGGSLSGFIVTSPDNTVLYNGVVIVTGY